MLFFKQSCKYSCGTIHWQGTNSSSIDSTFINIIVNQAGVIQHDSSNAHLTDSNFTGNTATSNGGTLIGMVLIVL